MFKIKDVRKYIKEKYCIKCKRRFLWITQGKNCYKVTIHDNNNELFVDWGGKRTIEIKEGQTISSYNLPRKVGKIIKAKCRNFKNLEKELKREKA